MIALSANIKHTSCHLSVQMSGNARPLCSVTSHIISLIPPLMCHYSFPGSIIKCFVWFSDYFRLPIIKLLILNVLSIHNGIVKTMSTMCGYWHFSILWGISLCKAEPFLDVMFGLITSRTFTLSRKSFSKYTSVTYKISLYQGSYLLAGNIAILLDVTCKTLAQWSVMLATLNKKHCTIVLLRYWNCNITLIIPTSFDPQVTIIRRANQSNMASDQTSHFCIYLMWCKRVHQSIRFIHSFSILSDDRSKASSKTMPPHSAIQSLLLQMRISSPVLKVIQ